ncbi:MAG: alpha/beta hydrolase [Haloechinothrix sp.]
MTATQRATSVAGSATSSHESPIRAGYRRFAGVRTRVFEVGPASTDAEGPRGFRLRRGRTSSTKPKRPRFVLLHGYCDSADTWQGVLRELGAAGHSAIAVDLPGFGEADPLRPGQILPQLDAFVAAVIKEQSPRGDVVLVGNSLGGTMSLRAAQNPWLPIAGVLSIATPGFADGWLVRTIGRYPLPLRLFTALPVPVPRFLVRAVADAVIPYLLYADARTAEVHEVQRFTTLFGDYPSTKTRLGQARQLVEELGEAYQIDRIQAPLLVVACGKDRLVSVAGGRRLHTLVPHSRLLVREDWGHCPQLDNPMELTQLICYFGAGCRYDRSDTDTDTSTTGIGHSESAAG